MAESIVLVLVRGGGKAGGVDSVWFLGSLVMMMRLSYKFWEERMCLFRINATPFFLVEL
jgi:hypothetical protein